MREPAVGRKMKKVVILGAGPGGYYTASKLYQESLDYKVCIVEKGEVGGTCLNIGCIPTKALLDHVSLTEQVEEGLAKRKVFSKAVLEASLEGLRKYQLEITSQLKSGIQKAFQKGNVELISGKGQFLSQRKILVEKSGGSKVEIDADHIVIATGSRPRQVPSFDFDNRLIVSSDEVWNIPSVPKKLLIVGTGPVGVEFARIFNKFGSEVTMTEIKETICPVLDKEISECLARSLKKKGIKTKPSVASKLLEKKENSVLVKFLSCTGEASETHEFDQVLVAVGRMPNVENLELEKAGIKVDEQGFVKVSKYLQTTKENIWAIGDVTNFPQLAHTASFQARIVAFNISTFTNKKDLVEFSGDVIPSCIYGYPEIAFVGITEEEAQKRQITYSVGKSFFIASGKAKASGLTEGMVKILMEKKSRKILGAHIIGPEASCLIHEIVVAMENGLTVDNLVKVIHAHPTYSETIHEALEDCLLKEEARSKEIKKQRTH